MDQYSRTLEALQHYRILAAEDDGAILPGTDQPVEPGQHYDGIPRLTRLLHRVGDLPADSVTLDTDLYQDALVSALKRFQCRHGLKPDGRIDNLTLMQLNTPLGVRVHQLELALERWRRRPFDPSQRAIVVNIPEFRLRAFGVNNHQELEMKIVVGQTPDHKTPLLSSQIETIIFHPYWNVPLSIQRDELVPEIVKDPSFLSANHLEMINAQGSLVQDEVSNETLALLRSGRLRLRQTPGPKNVLGPAKFEFPNTYGIYMHGTSAEWLFSEPRRDLSHGCIRLERVLDFAEWLLRGDPQWPRDHIASATQGSRSVVVKLKRPVQVVTMYVTAVTLEDGEIQFFDDVYGEDAILERELAAAGSLSASSCCIPAPLRPEFLKSAHP